MLQLLSGYRALSRERTSGAGRDTQAAYFWFRVSTSRGVRPRPMDDKGGAAMPVTSFPLDATRGSPGWLGPRLQRCCQLAADRRALESRGMRDPLVKVAAIATVSVETARTFRPIDEFGDDEYFTRMYENRTTSATRRRATGRATTAGGTSSSPGGPTTVATARSSASH